MSAASYPTLCDGIGVEAQKLPADFLESRRQPTPVSEETRSVGHQNKKPFSWLLEPTGHQFWQGPIVTAEAGANPRSNLKVVISLLAQEVDQVDPQAIWETVEFWAVLLPLLFAAFTLLWNGRREDKRIENQQTIQKAEPRYGAALNLREKAADHLAKAQQGLAHGTYSHRGNIPEDENPDQVLAAIRENVITARQQLVAASGAIQWLRVNGWDEEIRGAAKRGPRNPTNPLRGPRKVLRRVQDALQCPPPGNQPETPHTAHEKAIFSR